MFWILRQIRNFIKILNSNASPSQIAWGIASGAVLGLMPCSLLSLAAFFLILLVNVNLSASFLAMAVFSVAALALDGAAHEVGYMLLARLDALTPFWTRLYNMPLAPFTKFNNTVVLGSLTIGVALLVPNYFLFRKLVVLYRERVQGTIEKIKLFRMLGITQLYHWYTKFMAD